MFNNEYINCQSRLKQHVQGGPSRVQGPSNLQNLSIVTELMSFSINTHSFIFVEAGQS